jgi:PPP family 3-phenylpropionic acid transporter
MTSTEFRFRQSVINAVLFLGAGIQLPFLPLWLQDRGLDAGQIGLVIGMMTAIRIVAIPAGTYLADRLGNRRRIVLVGSVLTFASYLLLAVMPSFWPILTVAIVAAALFAPVGPLTEVLSIIGSVHHGIDYGRIRLWASLSFLTGSLVSGALLESIPISAVIPLIAGAQGVGALAALLMPPDPVTSSEPAKPVRARQVVEVVTGGTFMVFLLATGLGQASHGFIYAFGSVYFDHLGYGKLTIGALWAAAVTAEVTMFAFSNRLFARFGARRLMAMGILCGLVRWCVIGLGPPLAFVYAAMLLHAGSFGLTHLGTMHYIRQNVPANMRNSAQGVHAALSGGVLLSAFMWAAGPLYGALGGEAFFVMAAFSAVAFGLAVALVRLNPTVAGPAAT